MSIITGGRITYEVTLAHLTKLIADDLVLDPERLVLQWDASEATDQFDRPIGGVVVRGLHVTVTPLPENVWEKGREG